MKLKVIHDFTPHFKKGDVAEIDNIMRDPDGCASGIRVRVVGVWKSPTWVDLGWFVSPVIRPTKRAVGRLVRPAKKTLSKSDKSSAKVVGSPSRR